MHKKLFSVLLFAILFFNVSAQTLQSMSATNTMAVSQITGVPFRETLNNSDAVGSPYLFENWMPGKVSLFNGTTFENVMLKFDALQNKFYFKRNDSTFELPDDVTEVHLQNTEENNNELDFKKILSAGNRVNLETFVQVLATGKITLYKEISKITEGENYTNGMITSQKKIISHNSLWTIINNESIPVKLNKHSLEELTDDKKDAVENFLKSKRLNVKNEKKFTEIIDYYNKISVVK